MSFGVITEFVLSLRCNSVPRSDVIFCLTHSTSVISCVQDATVVLEPVSFSVVIFLGVRFTEFSSKFEAKFMIFFVLL